MFIEGMVEYRPGIDAERYVWKKVKSAFIERESFEKESELLVMIEHGMDAKRKILNSDTSKFISKKIQLYTLFSVFFDMLENDTPLCEDILKRFTLFVKVYDLFKNDAQIGDIGEANRETFDMINKYKLASSEGVNKFSNRMIRFEVIKKICVNENTEVNLVTLIKLLSHEL
ncbi:hypothetical protein [Bacillus wiedmannii]|uniref:Uncharacterized protein n=1 Tax=Bacillus wiedmannii TaxID=1890302 RepID=A0A2C4GAS7_9BACI|nr:hypothetical protein [Bacillus wiedmannii]PEJ11515.1 hypothetical protein CN684_00720 [Bacillus wiedmannii]PHC63814.1 hypothetical protein COF35_24470 [Bacillus wiedmannii]